MGAIIEPCKNAFPMSMGTGVQTKLQMCRERMYLKLSRKRSSGKGCELLTARPITPMPTAVSRIYVKERVMNVLSGEIPHKTVVSCVIQVIMYHEG